MDLALLRLRGRMDRWAMLLSGLRAVHCILGVVVVAAFRLGGGLLLAPLSHGVGLLLATMIAGVASGLGALRHRHRAPFVVGVTGVVFMGGALAVGNGVE